METLSSPTMSIGETAGAIWHALNEHGPLSLARLTKTVDAPRDQIMQGIGWLAREGKIDIEETSRGRFVTLK